MCVVWINDDANLMMFGLQNDVLDLMNKNQYNLLAKCVILNLQMSVSNGTLG